MSKKRYELNLLIFSESQIKSGLSLAKQVAEQSGFVSVITVISENPSRLKEQVRARLAEAQPPEDLGFAVESFSGEASDLVKQLDKLGSLRLVLLPGLDQLNDFRKALLRKLHATVVCFEAHPGLESSPGQLWLLEEDPKGDVRWVAEHLVAYPEIQNIESQQLDSIKQQESPEHDGSDWVFIAATNETLDSKLKTSKSTVESAIGPVVLVRGEASWWQWFVEREVPSWITTYVPQMERQQRQELSAKLEKYSKLDFEFIVLICSATFLAAFGLIQNSAAVIIGAMLVAPLMTPILGAGLSLAHGNRPLFWNSLKTISIGFVSALLASCIFGFLVRFLVPQILNFDDQQRLILTPEMWSRTYPTGLDFLVGLVGGSAAAFARTRTHLADALAGAAIAAALVPPIATAGLHASFAMMDIAPAVWKEEASNLFFGPVLLFIANALTIMIGSSFVLWACGIRSDHGHTRRERWTTRTTFLVLLSLTIGLLIWIVEHP